MRHAQHIWYSMGWTAYQALLKPCILNELEHPCVVMDVMTRSSFCQALSSLTCEQAYHRYFCGHSC